MNAKTLSDYPEIINEFGLQDIIITLLNSLSAVKHLSEIDCQVEDETQLIKQALTSLIQNQDMERCSFFILDKNGILTNVTGLSVSELTQQNSWLEKPLQFKIGEGIIGLAAASGCMQYCQNCREDARFAHTGEEQTIPGCIICTPIYTLNHHLIGVLNVSHPEPYYFTDWHIRLLEIYKNMLGQLITNRRLFQQMETQIAARTSELEQLVVETKRLKDYYASMSMTDQLTGLHNRRFFYNQVEIALAQHKRHFSPFCVLVMDIDHFKMVNDIYGHVFGDQVLIGVAETLREQVRSSDILVRFGGEEFVIIFTNTSCDNGYTFANRIRNAIKTLAWKIADKTINITMSIGLYCTNSDQCSNKIIENRDIDQIIHCADIALYLAKSSGRDQVIIYNEKMNK